MQIEGAGRVLAERAPVREQSERREQSADREDEQRAAPAPGAATARDAQVVGGVDAIAG